MIYQKIRYEEDVDLKNIKKDGLSLISYAASGKAKDDLIEFLLSKGHSVGDAHFYAILSRNRPILSPLLDALNSNNLSKLTLIMRIYFW